MSFCWLGKKSPLKDILIELGHSRQGLKKSEVSRNSLDKVFERGQEISLPASLMNKGEVYPKYGPHSERPKILEERGSLLALSKPSGVHCHPLHYGENDNLLSFLREEGYFDYININTEHMDRGLLYRLDFETSGLTLLTKDASLLKEVRTKKLVKNKTYFALVSGEYNGPLELENILTTTGKKVRESGDGKKARLKIIEANYDLSFNRTLLKVVLNEGLRHQIRVQLALTGFPLIGDTLYGGEPSDSFGLHSYSYTVGDETFTDPSFHLS